MRDILKEIKSDIVKYTKNKDLKHKTILNTLYSDIYVYCKDNKLEITNDIIIQKINYFIKKNKETIDIINKNNSNIQNTNLIDNLIDEILILSTYLPPKITEAKLKHEIDEYISLNHHCNFGEIMKFLNTNFKDQFDNKTASIIIKTKLNK